MKEKIPRPDPAEKILDTSTRAERATAGSEEQGAEVAPAAEREAVADDYEASARIGDKPPRRDFTDEVSTFDRPDTAAIAAEEEERSRSRTADGPHPKRDGTAVANRNEP